MADLNKANLGVTVEGTFEDFLGANIDRSKIWHHPPDTTPSDRKIGKGLRKEYPKTASNSTPVQPSKILHSHKQKEDFDKRFHYISVVGKLNYLEKCCR